MRVFASLVVTLLAALIEAKKDEPSIHSKEFHENLAGLFYFDDSNTILISERGTRSTFRSEDAGTTWNPLDGPEAGKVTEIVMHPWDKQTVVVLGEKKHWISKDRAKTFKEFETEQRASPSTAGITFHASDPNRMIFTGRSCLGFSCTSTTWYTTDGFETKPKLLKEGAESCLWAKSTPRFTTGDERLDKDQILCIVKGRSFFSNDNELRISSDFFNKEDNRPAMNGGSPVVGIARLASVQKYLVTAAKAPRTAELAMYVTEDTKTWHRAEFGDHRIEQDGYTLLESTNYSMQVDVQTSKYQPMGVLLTSNSNGTFFRRNMEHTNRNSDGFVDFEKVQDIQGIVLVNVVDNWEEVEKGRGRVEKKLKTRISFDDGTPDSWHEMKADDKQLHLHSVTAARNLGRVLSSPAPGICMGIGNTGDHLDEYNKGDTYVSDDAGLTWNRALKGPHLYEFGDKGGIIIAIEDGETDTIKYSLKHGQKDSWKETKLHEKVIPLALTTTPDSTSLKFVMTALRKDKEHKQYVYSFDFEGLHERECKSGDFEDWWARLDDKGKPSCIMGHKQKFRRRKADAECFVNQEFKDDEPMTEHCDCGEEDYECDHENGFSWNSDKKACELTGKLQPPMAKCKNDNDTFEGPSGYKLKTGNTCKGGKDLEKPTERKCGETKKAPVVSGNIGKDRFGFKGAKSAFEDVHYLERADTSSGDQETVVVRIGGDVFITEDHGKKWTQIKTKHNVIAIYPHTFKDDTAYLVTDKKVVYYTKDYGRLFKDGTWDEFEVPEAPYAEAGTRWLEFHGKASNDWLIWTGEGKHGQADAWYSLSGGEEWHHLKKDIGKCQFMYHELRGNASSTLVYCRAKEHDTTVLTSTLDWFHDKNQELMKSVVDYASMAEYIAVASKTPENKLKLHTSVDGTEFADAHFPANFQTEQDLATVLDSSTHNIFLHVTTQAGRDKEYGTILKSNSNGTNYVLSVHEVNRNADGYVDFEKVQGLEGVATINRVANPEKVNSGASKQLTTWMTHNDGADWARIAPPAEKPKDGPGWDCSGDLNKCSLHLHGYTEKASAEKSNSSPAAINILIATGNVGEFLSPKDKDHIYTFVSNDGGITWSVIAQGSWKWAFGDSGSVLVIAKEGEKTKTVKYSLDEGATWSDFTFSEEDVKILDLTTVPSDTSLRFLLWVQDSEGLATIRLDFGELKERSKQCKLNEEQPEADDFRLWTPKHPGSGDNDCLFGHVSQYHRKKVESQCYVGRKQEIKERHAKTRDCECTRADFECDYNFERQSDNSCKLVEGLKPQDPAEMCRKNPDQVEYYDITGYRKIPISTCKGGKELDHTSMNRPCAGHEDDYLEIHRMSNVAIFFAIVIPIIVATAVGYWVYEHWDGKFGRIRLGGDGPSFSAAGSNVFDRDAPWVKFPVMALSGVVAVIAALPLVIGSVWNAVSTALGRRRGGGLGSGPFTSRASFARGRGDYAVVDTDEGELLGEDSDEDV